jgi:hypothetical protein
MGLALFFFVTSLHRGSTSGLPVVGQTVVAMGAMSRLVVPAMMRDDFKSGANSDADIFRSGTCHFDVRSSERYGASAVSLGA